MKATRKRQTSHISSFAMLYMCVYIIHERQKALREDGVGGIKLNLCLDIFFSRQEASKGFIKDEKKEISHT